MSWILLWCIMIHHRAYSLFLRIVVTSMWIKIMTSGAPHGSKLFMKWLQSPWSSLLYQWFVVDRSFDPNTWHSELELFVRLVWILFDMMLCLSEVVALLVPESWCVSIYFLCNVQSEVLSCCGKSGIQNFIPLPDVCMLNPGPTTALRLISASYS